MGFPSGLGGIRFPFHNPKLMWGPHIHSHYGMNFKQVNNINQSHSPFPLFNSWNKHTIKVRGSLNCSPLSFFLYLFFEPRKLHYFLPKFGNQHNTSIEQPNKLEKVANKHTYNYPNPSTRMRKLEWPKGLSYDSLTKKPLKSLKQVNPP